MSLLTDSAILASLGKDIVIEPFDRANSLTAVGYDFSVGEFVFSLEKGLLTAVGGTYEIPPKSTVQILTSESLWVSGRIAGTFHSKVSLVSKGFSHISTTLDPNWYGPLLITMRNNRDIPLQLNANERFVTLVFYKVSKPTTTPSAKPAFRRDILFRDNAGLGKYLEQRTQEYVQKVSQIVENGNALQEFATQVALANRPMLAKVSQSIRFNKIRSIGVPALAVSVVLVPVALFISALIYWTDIETYFSSVPERALVAVIAGAITAVGGGLIAVYSKLKP